MSQLSVYSLVLRRKTLRLTKDSHDHAAGSHLPADLVFHGALVRPAVLGHGLDNEEGVNDLVGQDVFGVNGLHSLQEERETAQLEEGGGAAGNMATGLINNSGRLVLRADG